MQPSTIHNHPKRPARSKIMSLFGEVSRSFNHFRKKTSTYTVNRIVDRQSDPKEIQNYLGQPAVWTNLQGCGQRTQSSARQKVLAKMASLLYPADTPVSAGFFLIRASNLAYLLRLPIQGTIKIGVQPEIGPICLYGIVAHE